MFLIWFMKLFYRRVNLNVIFKMLLNMIKFEELLIEILMFVFYMKKFMSFNIVKCVMLF